MSVEEPSSCGPARHERARPLVALWQLLVPLVWMVFALLLLCAAIGTATWWLLRSDGGTAWLLGRLPGIHVTGMRGALLSPAWQIERLVIDLDGGVRSVAIDGLAAEGLAWTWRPGGNAWIGVHAARLSARRVELALREKSPPATPPLSLASALRAQIDDVAVGTVAIGTLPAATNVRARGTLAADDGAAHRLEALSFDWERVRVQGRAQIGTARPLPVDAELSVAPHEGQEWTGRLVAHGPLERLAASATLRADAPREGHQAPSLDLDATLAIFAPWPLASLQAKTTGLDLASFSDALPLTELQGRVEVRTAARDEPVVFDVLLDNAIPGRWDQHRLPLRHAQAQLRGDLRHTDALDIGSFDIALAAGGLDGGHWRGSGQWKDNTVQLQTTAVEVRPQLLDARALAAVVSGPVQISLALPRSNRSADVRAGAASPTFDIRGELEGRLDARPVPLKIRLDAQFNAERVLVRALEAHAGSAVAQLSAQAERSAAGAGATARWQLKTEGSLAEFDPVLWWPGEEGAAGAAWRRGPHRLSGTWNLDVQLPADAPRLAPVLLAQRTAGSGTVRLNDSVLAGVALQGELSLGYRGGAASPGSLHAEVRSGGSTLVLEGQGDPLGAGSADSAHGTVQIDSLARLAPLMRLVAPLADQAAAAAGRVDAEFTAEGRWPEIATHGHAAVQDLRLIDLAMGRGRVDWRLSGRGVDQPLSATLDASAMRLGTRTVDALHADVQGSLREHRMTLDAALPVRPPGWAENLLGLRAGAGTRVRLRAQGAWGEDGGGTGTWRGVVDEMLVGAGGDAARASASPGDWLEARDLRATLLFTPSRALQEVRAEAGRARIARDLQLRWDEIRVDAQRARPDFEIRAQVEPFDVAPMLARAQPTTGWSGDLRLKARLAVKADERFTADIALERDRGDLIIDDGTTRQALGMQSMRLALTAQDGRWNLAQQLSGRLLGEIDGEQQLTTAPGQRWPDAQASLAGHLEARVGNLGIWSAWVPPGWRLAGSLVTRATIGGRLGAPEYTGRAEGRGIAVRNLLLGVDVSDGVLDVSLQGERATIETLTLRGGDGRIEMSGQAELGSAPVAHLQAHAQRFRVLGRVDRQVVASGDAQVELRGDALKVDGKLKVDEGLFDVSRRDAPSLDDDVVIRDARAPRIEGDGTDGAKAAPPRRALQVNVAVDLGDKLHIRGRGLDTMLGGQLRVTTPGGRPALNGLVRTDGGTYAAYAQKLEIDRGILIFSGAPDNPGLDILALRPNIDTRVGVSITGTLLNPRVRLYSDPEMSETDKLSWLVLGRPSDGLGRADAAFLQRAAVALLAGEGEAPTDSLLRSLGIDELTVRQSDTDVRETVIALGKQLSRRWYVGYERSVNATTGTWQLIYRIAQRFTLRAQSGQENSLDVIWTWRVGGDEKKEPR